MPRAPSSQLIAPSSTSSHGHGKAGPEDSFFDYGKKGWHAPKPPDSYLRRRPLYRKVSKEEIRYPLLHPTDDMHDLLVESATMSAERDKQRSGAHRPPERPPRPSLEERPLVVRDPQLRMEEQKVYRSLNTAKRPERPREEDLPYGAKGSIPKALMSQERPPPPAVGRRSERTRENSVAFPSSREESARATSTRSGDPPANLFTPFAPLSSREAQHKRQQDHLQPPHSARSVPVPRSDMPAAPPSLRRNATVPEVERRPKPPPKDAKWLTAAATATATATTNTALPSHAQTHARRMRRTSSSGDVTLPSQSTRYQPLGQAYPPRPAALQMQDENVPRHAAVHARPHPPELRTVKSTPLSARQPPLPPPFLAAAGSGLPAHPAVHLDHKRTRHHHKPSDPDVPRDVSPIEAPHVLAPGRYFDGQTAVAHERSRSVSHTAYGVRPSAPDRAQERERERKRRREERERAAQERYYGKADAFARQITLALAEPERAAPLSVDWDTFVTGGVEYRTKPLAVTRKTKDREPRERLPRGGY
ncbi:hypothetical protein C8Q80DRAFT_1325635 [Daedaleopsis nitida]|nr:hypothetical protein C8Q80DRAFT_1325635 [Daedaleopsis nitida]